MRQKRKTVLIILIVFILIVGIVCIITVMNNKQEKKNDNNINNSSSIEVKNEDVIEWNEITSIGVDEVKLIENVDVATLEKIAALLQELTKEIAKKEKEDPDFAYSAGWYNYTLESSQFNEVINLGNTALKPLYLIIYKSSNKGLYEYICSMALEKISKVEIDNWNNSKDFLEKFNQEIVNSIER